MKFLFDTLLFNPLYNALVFLTGVLPGNNIALAVIVLTLIVKLILFPFYHKSTKAQSKIKEIEPKIKEIQKNFKDDRQKQAEQMMALYKEHGINPFSSFILLFIQLPIILALFFVFSRGSDLNLDILYSFVSVPSEVNTVFLGIFDVHTKSWILAFLVGLTQFFQMKLALPPLSPKQSGQTDFKADLMRSMQIQMKYVMPVVIVFIASTFPAAIPIYWLTSNLFAIGHELIIKKKALTLFKKA